MGTEGKSPWATVKHYASAAWNRYRHMHLGAKLFLWAVIAFYVLGGIAIIVITPARIFQFLYDKAEEFSQLRFGWIILSALLVFISFPPLVGHTTLVTLCGFAYGLKGFAIAAPASIVGAAVVFIAVRFMFQQRVRRWAATHDKWQALETVVRAKGLPLIILIRISPFPPWVWSNTFFANVEPVSLWQFLIATCFVFPKLFLHVFIGSRVARLADGETRKQMDTQTKVINGCLIGGGLLVAVVAGWLIYTLTQREIRKVQGVPPEVDELAAEAIEDFDEEAPLLGNSRDHSSN